MSVISAYSDGVPTVSFCLRNGAGNIVLQRNADSRFYSASTIKLGVLLAAMDSVTAGDLAPGHAMTNTRRFPSRVPGAGFFDLEAEEGDDGMVPGRETTLAEVLRRMIEVSSNEATNMAADLVGLDAVNAAVYRAGAVHSVMGRLFGDYAALAAGHTNETTAADLTLLMQAAANGVGDGAETMRGYLRGQQHVVIGAEIRAAQDTWWPEGVDWGSKSGSVTGIEHDAAFIRPAGMKPDEAYALAVCTRGYLPDAGHEVIRAVTASVVAGISAAARKETGAAARPEAAGI